MANQSYIIMVVIFAISHINSNVTFVNNFVDIILCIKTSKLKDRAARRRDEERHSPLLGYFLLP